MIKLIEKIIDYIFQNETILFMLCAFSGVMIIGAMFVVSDAYKLKRDTEIKLAKIAAGQIVDDK